LVDPISIILIAATSILLGATAQRGEELQRQRNERMQAQKQELQREQELQKQREQELQKQREIELQKLQILKYNKKNNENHESTKGIGVLERIWSRKK